MKKYRGENGRYYIDCESVDDELELEELLGDFNDVNTYDMHAEIEAEGDNIRLEKNTTNVLNILGDDIDDYS